MRYEPADVTNEDEVSPRRSTPPRRGTAGCTAWCTARAAARPSGRHPDRLRGVAAHRRPERQRHHVRAQARGARDGARRRRIVHRDLVDRGQQHPPLVRRRTGSPSRRIDHLMQLAADELGAVMGAGQLHPPGPDPHRTRCAGARFAGAERRLRGLHTAAAARRGRGHRQRWRCSCSATRPATSPARCINVDGGLLVRRGPGLLGDAGAGVRRRRPARRRIRLAAGRIGGSGLPGGQRADRRPVEVRAAAGQQRQEAIAQQAGHRHRHLQFFGGRQHQADVLLPQ